MNLLLMVGIAATVGGSGSEPRRQPNSISYIPIVAAGVPLKVIQVNLNDLNVRVSAQASKYRGHAEPFQQMVRRSQPSVALTGTFFCNRTKLPIGDLVIDGKLTHFGGIGTAMCITKENRVEFLKPELNRRQDWSGYDFVLCSGPRLVQNGVAYVEPKREGFRDKHMLNRNGRAAIGVTKDNQVLLAVTRDPVYLSKLARALKSIGCVDAINLDGGSSIGVYYKGKLLIRPTRWMTNLIVVYQDSSRYEEKKDLLLPVRMRSASR